MKTVKKSGKARARREDEARQRAGGWQTGMARIMNGSIAVK